MLIFFFTKAKELNESFAESRKSSGLGVEAARAYATIADDIIDAEKSVEKANELADSAIEQVKLFPLIEREKRKRKRKRGKKTGC